MVTTARSFAFLLTSTIAATLATSVMAASTPKVTLGGVINVQSAYSSEKSVFEAGQRHQGFRNDTEVHVNAEGESESGLKYGAAIELEADVTGDARGEGLNADKTYIWLEYGLGRWEMGNNAGPDQTMTVNAASIAVGTGGIDGDDEFYINKNGVLGASPYFLFHPDLYSAATGGIAEDAAKITYYSPRFSGFQVGISYAPDNGDGGQFATRNNTNGDMENVIAAGLNYEGGWDGIDFSAAIVGERGDSEVSTMEDLGAWQAGATLGFENGISIAGSYGDWNDSGLTKGSTRGGTDFWTLGAAYSVDAWSTSLTYLSSDHADDRYHSAVAGVEYDLAPGLTPYAELTYFKADEFGTSVDNRGTVLLVGTYLNF